MDFVVRLVQLVTGPAKEATDGLRAVKGAAEGADAALKAGSAQTKASASIREQVALLDKLAKAKASVSRLEGASRDIRTGKVVDLKAIKQLRDELAAGKGSVAELTRQAAKSGALKLDASEIAKARKAMEPAKPKASPEGSGLKGAKPGGDKGLASMLNVATMLKATLLGMAGLSVLNIGKLALGYQGMWRLQGLTARLALDFRRLFAGVNPKPALDGFERFTRTFNPLTVSGKAISGLFTRGFGAIARAVEAAEPYVTAFIRGIVLGFMQAEVWSLRARVALFPITSVLSDLVGGAETMKAAMLLGSVAVGILGVKMAIAAAPIVAVGVAIAAASAALEQWSKLQKEWDGDLFWRSVQEDLGLAKNIDEQYAEKFEAEKRARVAMQAKAQPAQDVGGGDGVRRAGGAIGDGLIAGMKAKEPEAKAAGAALVAAAEKGVREKGDIHSPSRLFRRRGQDMGEGGALGFEDKADRVRRAAETAMVPTPPTSHTASSASSPLQSGPVQIGPWYVTGANAVEIAEQVEMKLRGVFRGMAIELGVT